MWDKRNQMFLLNIEKRMEYMRLVSEYAVKMSKKAYRL